MKYLLFMDEEDMLGILYDESKSDDCEFWKDKRMVKEGPL